MVQQQILYSQSHAQIGLMMIRLKRYVEILWILLVITHHFSKISNSPSHCHPRANNHIQKFIFRTNSCGKWNNTLLGKWLSQKSWVYHILLLTKFILFHYSFFVTFWKIIRHKPKLLKQNRSLYLEFKIFLGKICENTRNWGKMSIVFSTKGFS
jgi:hypothetical protein